MTIRFACKCGQKFKARDDKSGKQIDCAKCGAKVTVPGSSVAEIVEEPAAASAARVARAMMKRGGDGAGVSSEDAPAMHGHGRMFGMREVEEQTDEEHHRAAEIGNLLLTRILPIGGGLLVVVFVFYWISARFLGVSATLPDLFDVSGVVTLDGEPVANATITFIPFNRGVKGSSVSGSIGRTDEKGRYTLYYVVDEPGVVPGDHLVEIVRNVVTQRSDDPKSVDSTEESLHQLAPNFDVKNGMLMVKIEDDTNSMNFELKKSP